jgi:PAS domain S-box-containing protein
MDAANQEPEHPAQPLIVGVGVAMTDLGVLQQTLAALAPRRDTTVVVQQLPGGTGRLAAARIAWSSRPVLDVEPGAQLEANTLYVCPMDLALAVVNGRFVLSRSDSCGDGRLPFDHLLTSLAAEFGPRAAAVLLSPTAFDGALGLQAVRSAGGLTAGESLCRSNKETDAANESTLPSGEALEATTGNGLLRERLTTALLDDTLATGRLQARERQQAIIARLGVRAFQEQSLQSFMDQTVREVRQTLNADCCDILELLPGRPCLLPRASVGWHDASPGNARLDADPDTLAGFTLLGGEPVVVADAATEKRCRLPLDAGASTAASAISCVIPQADAVYGVLAARAATPHRFTLEDADFLQAIAAVIGSAVAAHQTRRRQAVQGSIASVLARAVTADEGMTLVLERLATEMGACVGECWIPAPDGNLVCNLMSVRPPLTSPGVEGRLSPGPVGWGEGLVGRVFATGSPAWSTDLGESDECARFEFVPTLRLLTGMAFPVVCHSGVRGVIALFFRSHIAPDPLFASSFDVLGRMIGGFLARLEMENRMRGVTAIAESSHDAIVSFDCDGVVTGWLGGAERLYGYSAEDMIGAPLQRLVPEERHAEITALIDPIRRGAVIGPLETLRLHRDGTAVDVSVRASPIRDPRGNVIGVTATDRDIRQLKAAQTKLTEADQQKDEFLAMLGHELRNPLAAIHSAADLLKVHTADAPELGRTQAILERQTRHMAKLLDGLLDVSRIVRGQIAIETEAVDLATVCRELAEDVTAQVAGRQLEFCADLPGQPIWIRGDRVRLAQVIDNLLSNSIRYTPKGGRIDLRLSRHGADAVLCVSDNGIGIEPDLLPQIFGVFRQARQSLDRNLGGLGLGLPLVKSLVALHDGSIEARSDGPGQGAEFVVRLPLTDAPHVGAGDSTTEAAVRPLDIVLIEDNYDSADALRALLEMCGHRVTLAGDGEQGIAVVAERRPDAVLCDIGLPNGVTGYDVARRLRAQPHTADVLLVAITGYGRPEDKRRCLEAGFDSHLTKPLSLDVIEGLLTDAGTRRAG